MGLFNLYNMKWLYLLSVCFLFSVNSCDSEGEAKTLTDEPVPESADTAYFAGGCFWCVEASFDQIEGVYEALSGYSGGNMENPTYKLVSAGKTNHAESVMVIYEPRSINYATLLDIFFTAHDPTQLNRQGPDVGIQYRSAIFYTSEEEKNTIDQKTEALQANYGDKIVTEVTPFKAFYVAEEYHQNYEVNHPDNPYIKNVSQPKIERVAREFKDILKSKHQ